MKLNKLIELLKELETSMENEEGIRFTEGETLDAEELFNVMQFLQRCASQAGHYCQLEEPCNKKGTLLLKVTEGKKPITAQVKIWDNAEKKIRTRFSLQRLVTDEDGMISKKLGCGHYIAEVSCGPEYSTCDVEFDIIENETVSKIAQLERIIHFTDSGWVAGDLHHHSVYSSPAYGGTDPVIETPKQVCDSMKALGMQFGALSDHHNVLNHEEWRQQKNDFVPIMSKEISTSNGHVLQLGVDDDVIYDIPSGADRTNDKLRKEFIRICDEIRQKGGLPQINHPFDVSFSTRFNSEFLDMIEIFESMEIWNGATPFASGTINAKAFKAWLSFLEQGKRLTATAGSDTHNIYGDDYFGMIEWMDWLVNTVTKNPQIYPKQMITKVKYLKYLYETVWPRLVEWVEKSNTPSDIHNYVFTEGKNEPKEILEAIRQGKNFVSNGPLVRVSKLENELEIEVFTKNPIKALWMYTKSDERIQLNTTKESKDKIIYYNAHMTLRELSEAKWAVFFADGGENNMAITNPIFL